MRAGQEVGQKNALSIWGSDPVKVNELMESRWMSEAISRSVSLGGPVALLLRVLLARNPGERVWRIKNRRGQGDKQTAGERGGRWEEDKGSERGGRWNEDKEGNGLGG
eukprot:758524-Hanusia_phi.AAC.2